MLFFILKKSQDKKSIGSLDFKILKSIIGNGFFLDVDEDAF